MKKLIAISVVFALVAGAVFAVDLSGEVIGNVGVLQGDNSEKGDNDAKVTSSGDMKRIRLQGEGANDDGTFGGWIRVGQEDGDVGFAGHAWWKPIDQFKIWIGSNGGDGFFAKEGNTGWMFYQRASDVKVAMGGANVWGWSDYTTGFDNQWSGPGYLVSRNAFYGGGIDGGNALYMTISPVEIVDVNIEIPFFDHDDTKEVFKGLVGQVDLKFDFGNIALTYAGSNAGSAPADSRGKIFAYFNLGSIDKLSLDVGLSFTLPGENEYFHPLAAGLGVKVDITDAFGLKARVVASFAGDDEIFALLGDVLPYFAINDNLKIFASLGLTMLSPSEGDALIGWHVNPYVWIGQEWGPTFWAGVKLYGKNAPANIHAGGPDEGRVHWAIPIGIGVSF